MKTAESNLERASLPKVYLARHGETAWSLTCQHTGLADLPLTRHGEDNARALGYRLIGLSFDRVLTSPLQRASRTCQLAGYAAMAETDSNLVEWDYGDFEGLRSVDIHKLQPKWDLFRDGCPGGESPEEVGARADRVLERISSEEGNLLLFSSGHFLRVLAARWLGLEVGFGKNLSLSASSVSILGYENTLSKPVIQLWNDTSHLITEPITNAHYEFDTIVT